MNKVFRLKTSNSAQATQEILINGKAKNIEFRGALSVTTTTAIIIWAISCIKKISRTFIVVKAKNL